MDFLIGACVIMATNIGSIGECTQQLSQCILREADGKKEISIDKHFKIMKKCKQIYTGPLKKEPCTKILVEEDGTEPKQKQINPFG